MIVSYVMTGLTVAPFTVLMKATITPPVSESNNNIKSFRLFMQEKGGGDSSVVTAPDS